jgi:ubiquinone/menaquinone biosynthesis C-methylase UbiE
MKAFWDQRYSLEEYVYGEDPNAFLKAQLPKLKAGKALFPAEGEGRNAAFAAQLGWQVDAFDYSEAAKQKAEQLFTRKGVTVHYQHSTAENYPFLSNTYDLVFLCYAHLPPDSRAYLHKQVTRSLRQGGYVLLEGFHTDQLGRSSGGPKSEDMLFTLDQLHTEFEGLDIQQLDKNVYSLAEGNYHKGEAAVVRMIAQKL